MENVAAEPVRSGGPALEAPSPALEAPSPAEASALAWAVIDEGAQRKHRPGARTLAAFLRDAAGAHRTEKSDERTNIIDQGERVTYAFPRSELTALLRHLEACRLEKSTTHFSERQGTPEDPKSGLMLDFDIVVGDRKPVVTDRHYHRLANALVAALQKDIDFAAGPAGGTPLPAPLSEMKQLVFFTVKPEVAVLPALPAAGSAAKARYKFGVHMLVPGVKLARSYKKWLLRRFKADPAVLATLLEIGELRDPQESLDQNSASVPVLFFGSCKRGSVPYVLGAALEVSADLAFAGSAIIRRLEPKDLAGYNLAAELGLVHDAEYADGRAPLVRRQKYECRPDVAAAAQDWGARARKGVSEEELLLAEHSLSTLTLHNAEARRLHALLDLLSPDYSAERNKWRDVVFALANTSDQYKPLAVWFSQKCPEKWADGGQAALDQLWEDATARRAERPLTVRSVAYWARTSDPARYAEAEERSYFTVLTEFVYANGGKLQHYHVAKVLHAMLGAKFCVDVDPTAEGPRGAQHYCWYEFVLPGQPMRPGEVWKWRREKEPDDIQIYISEKLSRVFDQIDEHIGQRAADAEDEGKAKYYRALSKGFALSKSKLYEDGFKNKVINQAAYIFRRRGFAEQLDRTPGLFGTSNGVLQLGRRLRLVDHFHEYPVCRYTNVAWKPFNPDDPWTRLVLDAVADIIPEPDARDWILFHAAQGLSSAEKDGIMLMWEGGGQNGKTSFLRWVAKALGAYAAKFNIQLMCCEREDADRPNSAMMRFKHLNYAYSEETNKAQVLNTARMKEMINAGEISGRDLRGKQEEFTMHCNIVAASQFSFIVDTTDHGTWRRIRKYTSKTRFRRNPDKDNPFEKRDDQRFVRTYPNDPEFQSSVLSLLGHYSERLECEFGGELKNVYSPTIERETEEFRTSQDALHRWICEAVVVSPGSELEYTLGTLSGYFSDWYALNIDRKYRSAGHTIQDIEASVLSKYLRRAPNRSFVPPAPAAAPRCWCTR